MIVVASSRWRVLIARADDVVAEALLTAVLAITIAGILRTAGLSRIIAGGNQHLEGNAHSADAGPADCREPAQHRLTVAILVATAAQPAFSNAGLLARSLERHIVLVAVFPADAAIVTPLDAAAKVLVGCRGARATGAQGQRGHLVTQRALVFTRVEQLLASRLYLGLDDLCFGVVAPARETIFAQCAAEQGGFDGLLVCAVLIRRFTCFPVGAARRAAHQKYHPKQRKQWPHPAIKVHAVDDESKPLMPNGPVETQRSWTGSDVGVETERWARLVRPRERVAS